MVSLPLWTYNHAMENRRIRFVACSVVLGLGLSLMPTAFQAEAKMKLPGCFGGNCAPKPKEEFDAEAQNLIYKLSHQPELMNIEYLKYYIGRPHNEQHASQSLNPQYIWYDRDEKVKYELDLTQSLPGQVTHAQMTVHLDGMGLTFEQLGSIYGKPVKRFYDYRAQPAEVYSFVPTTYLAFSSPVNTFKCNEGKIVYSGPPLPQPGPEDMAQAEAAMVARGALMAKNNEHLVSRESIPVLEARAKTRPEDPEAHLHLAEAYKAHSDLVGAIGEYKVALALSGGNQDARDKALSALRQMHVIDDADPLDRRKLELVNGGQFLRAQRKDKNPADPNVPPNPPNRI